MSITEVSMSPKKALKALQIAYKDKCAAVDRLRNALEAKETINRLYMTTVDMMSAENRQLVGQLEEYRQREQATQCNALTLDQLKGMDGMAVWAGNDDSPEHFECFLVDCKSAYKPFILLNRHNNLMWQFMKSHAHPDGWSAYTRKPEKER